VLYVATAELRTFKAKRLAANECDGLGLDLADMPSGLFAIDESFGCCVTENDVSDLVECRFVWQGGKRIYGDFPPIRKALNVAVHLIKRCAGDVQRAKRSVDVKTGNRRNVHFFALSLREHKPIRSKPEGEACLCFGCLVFDVIDLGGFFERHGHTESDSLFPFADLVFPFEPPAIGVERSGLQVAAEALFERKQGVPKAKCGAPDYVNSLGS
jgi:hypothetical protein